MDEKTLAQKQELEKSVRWSRVIGAVNAGFAGGLGVQTVLLSLDGDTLTAFCLGAVAALNLGLAIVNGRAAVKSKRMIDDIVLKQFEKDAKLKQLQEKYQKQR